MDKSQIIALIEATVKKIFTRRIPMDTPTDKLQLVNKKYVDNQITTHTTTPAGATGEVQFNNAGAFGSNSNFFFTTGTGIVTVDNGIAGSAGGNVSVTAPNGSASAGYDVVLNAGAGNGGTNHGGSIQLNTGVGASTGARGDVIAGVQVATTSNGGFLVLPTCQGAPTGTPTFTTSSLIYDQTNNKLYVYNAGWKSVTLA